MPKVTKTLGMGFEMFFSVLFAMMLVMIQKVNITGNIFSTNAEAVFTEITIGDLIKLLVYCVLTFAGVIVLEKIVLLVREKPGLARRKSQPYIWGLITILFILIWLPCVVTYAPGGLYADTFKSIAMVKGEEPLSNHHPILYTMSWKLLYIMGDCFGMSEYNVLLAYTTLQLIAMALVAGYLLYDLYNKGFSLWLIFLCGVYFALFNAIPLYIVSLWKDTPFSIVFFIFSVFIFDLLWDEENELRFLTLKTTLLYSFLAFLVCFMRNNGIYVFSLFSIGILLYFKRKRKNRLFGHYLKVSAILLCLFVIIRWPIYNYFQLNYDDKVESLGVPLQQVCYVVTNGGKVSEKDIEIINNIIPIGEMEAVYCPLIVDRIKGAPSFNRDYLCRNMWQFWGMFFRVVAHNPVKAFKGWALATEGFWDPTRQTNDAYINNFMWPGSWVEMKDSLSTMTGISLQSYYSPRIYYSSALFAWFLFGALVVGSKNRSEGFFLSLLPAIGLWITLLIATPIAYSLRYAFSLVLLIPLGLAVVFAPDKDLSEVLQ